MNFTQKIVIKLHSWLAWVGVNYAIFIVLIDILRVGDEDLQVIFIALFLFSLPLSIMYVVIINRYLTEIELQTETPTENEKPLPENRDPLEKYYTNFF
jgi:hypothetical protein